MAQGYDDSEYPGSRAKRQRYGYNEKSASFFIELMPAASCGDPSVVIASFRQSLLEVPGVRRVDWHPAGSKEQQGNVGNHYQAHNFAVYSHEDPKIFLEFELTRNNHMADMTNRSFTVTAMYKNPPHHMIPEAFRILRKACAGKELLPTLVDEMGAKFLSKWMSEVKPEILPGSASSSAAAAASGASQPPASSSGPSQPDSSFVQYFRGGQPIRTDRPPPKAMPRPPTNPPPVKAKLGDFQEEHELALAVQVSQQVDNALVAGANAMAKTALSTEGQRTRETCKEATESPHVAEPMPREAKLSPPMATSAEEAVQRSGQRAAELETGAGPLCQPPVPVLMLPPLLEPPPPLPLPRPLVLPVSPDFGSGSANPEEGAGVAIAHDVVPQTSPLSAAADADISGASFEEIVDWGCDNESDDAKIDPDVAHTLFVGDATGAAEECLAAEVAADDFTASTHVDPAKLLDGGPVSDSAIERLGLHLEDTRDMFPQYLQPPVVQRLGISKIMADAQAFKARACEDVRFRSSRLYVVDITFQCVQHQMKQALTVYCLSIEGKKELGQLAACFTEHPAISPQSFLDAMHRKALKVTDMKKDGQDDKLQEYRCLFSVLPAIVHEKIPEDQLQTASGVARVLSQLVNKHSGELVELECDSDNTRGGWCPCFGRHNQFGCSEQWYCVDGGHAAGAGDDQTEWTPMGGERRGEISRGMEQEIKRILSTQPGSASHNRLTYAQLQPDWRAQKFRVSAPCVGTSRFCWVRFGTVISLGQPLLILGLYDAAEFIL